eukprot:6173563-Pleurochrysis_carterae.AAC.1
MTAHTANRYRAVRSGVSEALIWTVHFGVERGARRFYGAAQGKGRAATAIAIMNIQELGSGARALREYTCDASPKRQTVHMSARLR